jgi:hypothetical protein
MTRIIDDGEVEIGREDFRGVLCRSKPKPGQILMIGEIFPPCLSLVHSGEDGEYICQVKGHSKTATAEGSTGNKTIDRESGSICMLIS